MGSGKMCLWLLLFFLTKKSTPLAEEAWGDCVISDDYVGVCETGRKSEVRKTWQQEFFFSFFPFFLSFLDILFETLPLAVRVPRGFEIGFT